jgi:3-phosphoshikimate 1-carboxyvinyltransferase
VVRFDPSGPLRGSLRPPPDKSISHRAAILAAMGDGTTEIEGYLDSADTRSTLTAVRALGAEPDAAGPAPLPPRIAIAGAGLSGAREARIDVGNAGTLLRLLPGWLAGQREGRWRLDGDDSIRARPVDRIAEPLRRMGASLRCREQRLPPLEIEGAALHAIEYELPVASAQVKSCVLLAGLQAEGTTVVREPVPTRDHTERMLAAAGVEIGLERVEENGGHGSIVITATERLEPGRIAVPGDFSSAAFALVAALLVPGSEVAIEDVGLNPTRTGLLGILERMGAQIEAEAAGEVGPEPTGTLRARHSELVATEVGGDEVALAIDELPLVALAACFAEGETVIRDAGELRRKESDRVATVVAALRELGGEAEPTAEGLAVRGTGGLRGGTVGAGGDHRIAMVGAVAGLASAEGACVEGFEAADVSYPGFAGDLASLRRG